MRSFKARCRPSSFFSVRTPLLPYDDYERWGRDLEAVGVRMNDRKALERGVEADRETLRVRLRIVLERPEVLDALFVASPSLWEAIPRWINAPDSSEGLGVERSLVRYLTRMTTRATPFGLFAGLSVGRIASEDQSGTASLRSRQEVCKRRQAAASSSACSLSSSSALIPSTKRAPRATSGSSWG